MAGWEAASKWVEHSKSDDVAFMREVWTVQGPAPFGGLTAQDEGQAHSVADMLNRLYGRSAP